MLPPLLVLTVSMTIAPWPRRVLWTVAMSAASAVVAVGSFDWPPPQAATVARTAISTAVIAANFIFDFMVQIRQIFSGQASACLGGMRRDSVQSARNHDLPKKVVGGAVS